MMSARAATLRVGIVQMNTGEDLAQSALALENAVRTAVAQGAEMIVTPEYTNLCHGDAAALYGIATSIDKDAVVLRAQSLAKELSVCIVLGSVIVTRSDGKFANRALLIAADGTIAAAYDKIHLFDLDRGEGRATSESAHFVAGDRAVVAQTPWGGLGLTICYDIRFSYLYRALAQTGASLIVVGGALTRKTGGAHWETLLRARAIETGAFILAPAQGGVHPAGRTTWGHSMIVDPWGTVITTLRGDAPGVAVAELSLNTITRARLALPGWAADKSFKTGKTIA